MKSNKRVKYILFLALFVYLLCVFIYSYNKPCGEQPSIDYTERYFSIDTCCHIDYDPWPDFIQAIMLKESGGDSLAIGRCNDVGILQITPIMVKDANRILGAEKYTLKDRTSVSKSIEIFNIIQDHYNPDHDFHLALKIWNPKAPISYHNDIMYIYDTIKGNNYIYANFSDMELPENPID